MARKEIRRSKRIKGKGENLGWKEMNQWTRGDAGTTSSRGTFGM